MKHKALLAILIFLPLIACDRYTKVQAVTHLKEQPPLIYLDGFFTLTYHENTGAMLSLGASLPEELRFIIFTVAIALVLFGGLLYIMVKPMHQLSYIVGMLILTGGFGNLYDRAFNEGRVVDFMLLQLGPLRTGVFNLADIAIMIGLFGFILLSSGWGKRYLNGSKTY